MYELRDYQKELYNSIREALKTSKRIIAVACMRYGKTVLFSFLSKCYDDFSKDKAMDEKYPVMILTHREELFRQTFEKVISFGVNAGQIRSGVGITKNNITIAMIGTVVSKLKKQEKLRKSQNNENITIITPPKIIIIDECFIKGSKVETINGKKSIEKIKNGDIVFTFNEEKKQLELNKVLKLIKKENKETLLKINNKITCTENHLFYTQNGWKKASELIIGFDMVLNIMVESNKNGANNEFKLRSMWKSFNFRRTNKIPKKQIKNKEKSLLLFNLFKRILQKTFIRNNVKNKFEICIGKNENKKSYAQSSYKRKSKNFFESYFSQAKNTRWKWTRSNNTSNCTCKRIGMGYGSCSENKNGSSIRLSNLLQIGYWKQYFKNWYRSRWKFPLCIRKTKTGCEKRFVSKWVRVESIEIQKQRNRNKFGWLHKKNYVYDLTVENNHNYFIENTLVHNCHHTISASWTWAINHFPDATIIGFTGTPIRLDNKPLYPMFDKMIEGRSMKWMIENYWITPYKHLCPPSPIEEMKIKMKGKDYDTDSQTKEFCTRTVAADVLKYYKQYLNGLQTICFCCDLKHAEYYKEFFDENNYPSQIIHAGSKNRKQIMEDYKSGKYPILISIDILSEGVDVPCCYGILSLRKTASLSLYLQQFSRPLTPSYADGYNIEIKSERKKAMEQIKPFGVILDFVGNVFQHGKVDDEREWTLHPEKKDKKKKKTTIEKKQCPECQFYLPQSAKTCEVCGHDFEQNIKIQKQLKIEQLAGELVNVHDLIPDEALSLSKTIERIKAQQNPIKPLYAILHKSVEHGEGNMRKKVSAMCKGLGYTDKFSHVVWARLRKIHGEKLDKLA